MTEENRQEPAKETRAEALVKLLREVVQAPEAPAAAAPAPARPRVFVLLFAADVVLLLAAVSDNVLESPLLKLAGTVFSALLGAGLIAYLELVRTKLLEMADGRAFRRGSAIAFALLLFYHAMLRFPLYALEVRTDPGNAMVEPPSADADVTKEGRVFVVSHLALESHVITATVPSGTAILSDRVEVDRLDLALATLGRVWPVDVLYHPDPIPLTPRYPVSIQHVAEGGWLEVHGAFSRWFLRSTGRLHENSAFAVVKGADGAHVEFPMEEALVVPGTGARPETTTEEVYLPKASGYTFCIRVREGCYRVKPSPVPPDSSLNFTHLPCAKTCP